MKSLYSLYFFFLIICVSTVAQVADSIVIKTDRSISDSHPMLFSGMAVDSFSFGNKTGASSWYWLNNNWNLGGRIHYDYDAQNRLSVISEYSYI